MNEPAESVIVYCRKNNRVCPQPELWKQLWEMLPDRKRVGASWQPPLPLILAAWHETPVMSKMVRLAEHIQWAETHDALGKVAGFLRSLREEEWHHIGE